MLYPAELRGRVWRRRRPAGAARRPPWTPLSWQLRGSSEGSQPGSRRRGLPQYLAALERKSVKVPPMSPVESDEADLTRKQRREQARAERKAMEEAAAASAVRRTRLTQLGHRGGGRRRGDRRGPRRHRRRIQSKGIPRPNTNSNSVATKSPRWSAASPRTATSLGSPDGAVTLQYFGDLECPICQKFTLGALPTVIQKWVRTGKLKIEYHSLETATREPEVFKSQQVAAWRRASRTKRGTSSRPSTTSREKRTRAT